jgi:phosphohistidine phosphatase
MARARTVYLVRHAIAVERGPDYPDDTVRPLTPRGIRRMRQASRGFRTLDPDLEVVFTSPLVRARQTAEILREAFDDPPRLAEADALAPDQAPEEIARVLGSESSARIALVGHEPDLGQLAAWWVGSASPLTFRKGGIACLELSGRPGPGAGRLIWFALPKMLRALGG